MSGRVGRRQGQRVARVCDFGSVPFDEQLLPFGLCQERQLGAPLFGVGRDTLQHSPEVPQQARHQGGVEPAAIVGGPQRQRRAWQSHYRQGVACPAPFSPNGPDLQIPAVRSWDARHRVLGDEDALEQRPARRDVTASLDLCQRTVLVLPELDHLVLQLFQPRHEPIVGRHLAPAPGGC